MPFKPVQRLSQMEPRLSGAICLIILLAILIVGLWPFDFSPRNEVRWIPDRNGVHFYGQGMIVASAARALAPPPFGTNESAPHCDPV